MADYRVRVYVGIERGTIRNGVFIRGTAPEDLIGRVDDSVVFTAPITRAQARTFFDNIAGQLREIIVNDPRMNGIIT
jgi:hypothetical protein